MKALVVAAALALTVVPAQAEDICDVLGLLAERMMSGRQNGVAMDRMVATIKKYSLAELGLDDIVNNMLIMAYESPRFSSEGAKSRATADFKDRQYLICVKATQHQ